MLCLVLNLENGKWGLELLLPALSVNDKVTYERSIMHHTFGVIEVIYLSPKEEILLEVQPSLILCKMILYGYLLLNRSSIDSWCSCLLWIPDLIDFSLVFLLKVSSKSNLKMKQ